MSKNNTVNTPEVDELKNKGKAIVDVANSVDLGSTNPSDSLTLTSSSSTIVEEVLAFTGTLEAYCVAAKHIPDGSFNLLFYHPLSEGFFVQRDNQARGYERFAFAAADIKALSLKEAFNIFQESDKKNVAIDSLFPKGAPGGEGI